MQVTDLSMIYLDGTQLHTKHLYPKKLGITKTKFVFNTYWSYSTLGYNELNFKCWNR